MNFRKYESMFKWNERYSVGVEEIDYQHKIIFTILDKLYNSLKVGRVEIVLNQILPELEDYTVQHFQKEEFFFEKFNFTDTEAHIREHEGFKCKLIEIRHEIQTGRDAISFDLMVFLKNWIDHHILVADRQYSECFRQNGLK